MIGAHGLPDRGERQPCGGIDLLALRERGGSSTSCCGGGREFLRHHAGAFGFGRSAAGGDPGQTQRDDAPRLKPKVEHVDPKLPPGEHFVPTEANLKSWH
jgi:hypothetical protein